jgi:hypothetical protein
MSMDRVNSRETEKISVAKRQEDEKNATVDNTFADQGTRLPWRQDNSNGVRPTSPALVNPTLLYVSANGPPPYNDSISTPFPCTGVKGE